MPGLILPNLLFPETAIESSEPTPPAAGSHSTSHTLSPTRNLHTTTTPLVSDSIHELKALAERYGCSELQRLAARWSRQ